MGLIEIVSANELLEFRPALAMIAQLQQLRDEADQAMREGLAEALEKIRRFEQGG